MHMKRLVCGLLLVLLSFLPGNIWADSPTHGLPSETRQRQVWFGDALGQGYVVASCLPATSGTTTLAAFACEGYVRDSSTGELLYAAQAQAAHGPLSSGDGTYWVALHADTSTAV